MKSFPVVNCAICGTRVSNMQVHINPKKNVFNVLVQCHGHVQKCEFPVELFDDGWSITAAEAFANELPKKVEVVEGEIVEKSVTSKTGFPVLCTFTEDELEKAYQIREEEIAMGLMSPPASSCLVFDVPKKTDKFDLPTGTWALGLKEAI